MTGQIAGELRAGTKPCSCGREHKQTFHIYLDGPWWRWCCTLCQPPARGARWHHYYGGVQHGLRTVVRVSMKYHFRVRSQHHAFVVAHGRQARRA